MLERPSSDLLDERNEESIDRNGKYYLFFNSMAYQVSIDFLNILKKPEVIKCLIQNQFYDVKSNVNEFVFVSFINYACYGEIPYIDCFSIEDFKKISHEFGMMRHLIKIAVSNQNSINPGEYDDLGRRYNISRNLLLTRDGKITQDLLISYEKELHKPFAGYVPVPIRIDDFVYILDDVNNLAFVVNCLSNSSNVIIPASFEFGGVKYSVSKIMAYSFRNAKKVTSIAFAEDSKVTTIEKNAFNSSSVVQIEVPDSLKRLEFGWCYGAYKLERLIIHQNNESFKNLSYDGQEYILCESVQGSKEYDTIIFMRRSIEVALIPQFIKYIGPFSFYNCKRLHQIGFEKNSQLHTISEYSFADSTIESFFVPKSVHQLKEGAFFNCQNLKRVKFQINSNIKKIGKFAFCFCQFRKIFIPKTIEEIDDGAFYECKNLSKISQAWRMELRRIGSFALYNTQITSLKLGEKFHSVNSRWCHGAKSLKKIILHSSNDHLYYINGSCLVEQRESEDNYCHLVFAPRNLEIIVIPSFVKEIDECSFCDCREFTTIYFTIDSILDKIGASAFMNCNLEGVFIPKHAHTICEGAFSDCHNLMKVIFEAESEMKRLGVFSFSGSSICDLEIPKRAIDIGQGTFYNCKNLTRFLLPEQEDFVVINNYLFSGSSLANIMIPKNVKYICEYSFCNCSKLEHVEFSEGSKLEVIGKKAFKNSSIVNMNVPEEIGQIGEGAFSRCTNLQNFTFPVEPKIRKIEPKTFSKSGFKTIDIPSHIEEIDEKVFSCSKIERVNFAKDSKLKIIGQSSFSRSCLVEIEIPSGVQELGDYAFYGSPKLEKVNFLSKEKGNSFGYVAIPNNVQRVGHFIFDYCLKLQST